MQTYRQTYTLTGEIESRGEGELEKGDGVWVCLRMGTGEDLAWETCSNGREVGAPAGLEVEGSRRKA